MSSDQPPSSNNHNQRLLFWVAGTALTVLLGVGTPVYNGVERKFESHLSMIEDNRSKIWEQQRTSVTEENLSRRVAEIVQLVDSKIDGIQTLQREQSKQLGTLIESQTEFQKDVRKALKEKVDK